MREKINFLSKKNYVSNYKAEVKIASPPKKTTLDSILEKQNKTELTKNFKNVKMNVRRYNENE